MANTTTKTTGKSAKAAEEKLPDYLKSGLVDIIKYRWVYLLVSVIPLVAGVVIMIMAAIQSPNHSPLALGIDFTGGTILEYGFERKLEQADLPVVQKIFEDRGYSGSVVQLQAPRESVLDAEKSQSEASETVGFKPSSLLSVRSKQIKSGDQAPIETDLTAKLGKLTLMQKNSIGPTLASEILTSGLLALVSAYLLIMGYLSFRFQFDYAVCAILALIHDSLFVFGAFAALGYFYHIEVDAMFVTAVLTVVGFSVHDTIVVFDRLRENTRIFYSKKLPFGQVANISINQTLARSINTSLTALLPLITLYFLGGETTKWFVFTLLIGIIAGTYSSIFVASMLLVWWRERTVDTKNAIPV